MFTCDRCLKSFTIKQSYQRHISKAIPCKLKNKSEIKLIEDERNDIIDDVKGNRIESYKCQSCDKVYSRIYELNKHLENANNKCFLLKVLKESGTGPTVNIGEINQMVNNQMVSNQINNQTVNNEPKKNILFVEHGKERIDHITRQIMLELLNKTNFNDMCCELIKLMYFNKDVPENSNWMIAYPKNPKAGVEYNYSTNQFERKYTVDIVDDKFTNLIDLLQPLIEEIFREDERDNILNAQQRRNINQYYEHVGMLEISKERSEEHTSELQSQR